MWKIEGKCGFIIYTLLTTHVKFKYVVFGIHLQDTKKNATPDLGETFEPVEQANLSPLTVKIVEKSMFSETTLGTTELDLEALGLCKDKEAPVEVVNTKENGEKDVVGKLKLKVSIEGTLLLSFRPK